MKPPWDHPPMGLLVVFLLLLAVIAIAYLGRLVVPKRLRDKWDATTGIFRLGARIALFFNLLVILVLGGSALVGRLTVGEVFHAENMALRAEQAAHIAAELEDRVSGEGLADRGVEAELRLLADERHKTLAVLDLDGDLVVATAERTTTRWRGEEEVLPCGRRSCAVEPGPGLRTLVPLMHDDERVATLEVSRADLPELYWETFHHGLLAIALLALFAIALLSISLTRPLRRMSRSMDRVAGGDLDHRVSVKRRDEVGRMGRSFNTMADKVRSMIRGQRELMAGVSHELRSPLARMKLNLEMLREGGADKKKLDAIDGEVDALDDLIGELIVIGRLDLGTGSFKLEEVSLEEVVNEGWRRATADKEASEVSIEVDIPDDAAIVEADRQLVQRTLGNLLENAVRYGAGEPVTVTTRRKDDRVEVTVADRGAGVSDKELAQIFEPFYRADSSRSRKTGGTGLGLMIVQRATEAHGGKATAKNGPDSGLAVTIDLPAARERG